MATYRFTNTSADGVSLKLTERPVYGSARLGSLRMEVELNQVATFDPTAAISVQQIDLNYELTDHLGNVSAVVTGRLLDGNGGGTPKQAELLSAQGYEAFGSLLPWRNYSSGSYRFGFNGMEKDDEVHSATGTSLDFVARIYDPRIGRWLSLDPASKSMPGISPYAFSFNCPTIVKDPDGKNGEVTINYGTHTVVLSSTVYLYGPGASATAAAQIQQAFDNGTNTYWVQDPKDASITWTVKIDVTYVYDETVSAVAEAHGLGDQATIEANFGNGVPNSELGIRPQDNLARIDPSFTGREGGMAGRGGNLSWSKDNQKVLHESFHQLGFDERYFHGGLTVKGLESDFLSNVDMSTVMPFHYAHVLDFALDVSGGVTGSYTYNNLTRTTNTGQSQDMGIGPDGTRIIKSSASSASSLIDDTNSGFDPLRGVSEGNARAKPATDK